MDKCNGNAGSSQQTLADGREGSLEIGQPKHKEIEPSQTAQRQEHTHGQHNVPSQRTISKLGQQISSRIVSSTQHSVYLVGLFSGAELPFPLTLRSKIPRTGPKPGSNIVKISSRLPPEMTRKLFDTYVKRILPQCPIFSPTEVYMIYSRVYGDRSESPTIAKGDSFIALMIMAIATITSDSENFQRVFDITDALLREALDSDDGGELLTTTSIRCLQGLLLLVQYGLFVPQAIDLWHTASEAMRIAIELGLHREAPAILNFDEQTCQCRRRLFWAVSNFHLSTPSRLIFCKQTYGMERAVGLTCHRILAIRDDQIKLKNSPMSQADAETLTWGGQLTIARYRTQLAYCMLQTEISAINLGHEQFPSPILTHSEWVMSCERRIEELRGSSWTDAILIPDWYDLPAWRCFAWLYMPCPRNPYPSDETMVKFIKAIVHMLEIYWTLERKNSLKLCWFAVHHAYEIGTQMLFCMQNYSHLVEACFGKVRILEALTHLSDFLVSCKGFRLKDRPFAYSEKIQMERRWPAAAQCRALLDKLKNRIIEAFLSTRPLDQITDNYTGEQRIVDIIFRKNGYFFLSTEEPFNIQSHLEYSLGSSERNLVPQYSTLETISGSLDDLNDQISIPYDELGDWLMETSVAHTGSAGCSSSAIISPWPTTEAPSRSTALQDQIDLCSQNLANLQVCKFCKSKRIKCSRTLPSCHNCIDYGKKCLYMESSTGEWVAGRYDDIFENKSSSEGV